MLNQRGLDNTQVNIVRRYVRDSVYKRITYGTPLDQAIAGLAWEVQEAIRAELWDRYMMRASARATNRASRPKRVMSEETKAKIAATRAANRARKEAMAGSGIRSRRRRPTLRLMM